MSDVKTYVPLEEAKELKALGFNEPCDGYYRKLLGTKDTFITYTPMDGKTFTNSEFTGGIHEVYAIPTVEQAKQFRSK